MRIREQEPQPEDIFDLNILPEKMNDLAEYIQEAIGTAAATTSEHQSLILLVKALGDIQHDILVLAGEVEDLLE